MKKKLLVLCLAVGTLLSLSAQEKTGNKKDVPASVQTTFKSQYPDASGADWKMKDGNYKVHFKMNGTKQIANYDQSGTLLSKGVEVKESELPATIGTSTKSLYAGRSIDQAYKIDKNGVTSYLVKLKGSPETKILYSADGQVIKNKSAW